MMSTTLSWIYADRLQCAPDRKIKIRGRSGFAFSDVRIIIAEAALDENFQSIWPLPKQSTTKFICPNPAASGCLNAAGILMYKYTGNSSSIDKRIISILC